jgi:predicted nucleic acid-binding protein
VFVALVDERDALHRAAVKDLKALQPGPFAATSLVLGESCFLLPEGYLRRRLLHLLRRASVRPMELEAPWWEEVLTWLERYQDHEPDLADAQMAILCTRDPTCRVWSYDAEFMSTWRRPDGTAIPLAGRVPGARIRRRPPHRR